MSTNCYQFQRIDINHDIEKELSSKFFHKPKLQSYEHYMH